MYDDILFRCLTATLFYDDEELELNVPSGCESLEFWAEYFSKKKMCRPGDVIIAEDVGYSEFGDNLVETYSYVTRWEDDGDRGYDIGNIMAVFERKGNVI